MSRRHGFTLIELLVVIGIIAVLAAILFPVFFIARAMARRTACISQLHQIGLALRMYYQDYDSFPPHLSAINDAYVRDPRIFVCPSDPNHGHFAGNTRVEGDLFLPGGVSYGYLPLWDQASELGWWNPAPDFGPGKWDDLTPIVDCNWHWATLFNPLLKRNAPGSRGWVMMLTAGASVRKIRVEDSLDGFTPDRYR